MKTFAAFALPVFVAVWFAALLGGFAFAFCEMRQAVKHRRKSRVPPRARLRESRRMAWYRVTRRMPGNCPVPDLYRLTDEDRVEFGGMTIFYREDSASQGRSERARRQT